MTFSKKVKLTAAIYQDVDLEDMHADHIIPRSKGGTDDIENCQILSPTANILKGDRMNDLREWQENFLFKWDSHNNDPFLLVAIPGAGKTIAALTAAKRYLDAGNDRCLIVVVPSVNLQTQWRDEARPFGIHLQTKEFFGANFKDNFRGAVVTYQSLDNWAIMRKICSCHFTMVIMDEPHHCSINQKWGIDVGLAFPLAKRMLLLSGTPFRHDGVPIPFVSYDGEGRSVSHDRYDYPTALNDGVIREILFDYSKGGYSEFKNGEQQDYELHSDLSEDEADPRLRKILNAEGSFISDMIRQAHDKLLELRKTIPDSAAMAVCYDQIHASQIANTIKRLTKCTPSIIVSDEEIATDNIKKFCNTKSQWLVSVRQVSEGTDIKRLQVLCYFTTAKTPIFFRQLIGRISRRRWADSKESQQKNGLPIAPNDDVAQVDSGAYVFLPDHPRLVEHAKHIEEAQNLALKEQVERERRAASEWQLSDPGIFLDSYRDGTASVIIGSRQYSVEDAQAIATIAKRFNTTEQRAAKIYSAPEWSKEVYQQPHPQQRESATKSLEEIMDAVRRKCNKRACYLAIRVVGCPVEEIHMRFKKRQNQMNLEELEQKLAKLNEWISKEKIE